MFQLISGSFMVGIDFFIFFSIFLVLTFRYCQKWVLQRKLRESAVVHAPIMAFLKIILFFNLGSFLFGLFIVVIPNIPDIGEFWVVNRGNIGSLFYTILILPSVSYLILIRRIKVRQLKLLRKITIYVLIVVLISGVLYNSIAIAGIKPYLLWMARRVSTTSLLVLLSLYAICGLIIEKKRPAPFYFSLVAGLSFTVTMLVVNNTYHLSPYFASTFPLNFPSFFASTALLFFFVLKVTYDIESSDFTMFKKGRLVQFDIWGPDEE